METKLYSLEGIFTLQPPDKTNNSSNSSPSIPPASQELYTITKVELPSKEDSWNFYSYLRKMPKLLSQLPPNTSNSNNNNNNYIRSPMLDEIEEW